MTHSFSLVDEPWIPVVSAGEVREVGLREALVRAHEFGGLACARPPEHAAVFRLLLACLYRIFGGPGVSGLADGTFPKLYGAGHFDAAAVDVYFGRWRHRFDLFDPERPFAQVTGIARANGVPGDEGPISLLEFDRASGANATLFDHSVDAQPSARTPAQAARALLAFQGFAAGGRVNNEKDSKKGGLVRGGVQLFIEGETLWQSLALNLLDGDPYPVTVRPDLPAWEREGHVESILRTPGGWLDALTWCSRRVVLHVEGGAGAPRVARVTVAGGFDPVDDSLIDPHVRRRLDSTGKMLLPLKLDPDRALWRSADALFGLHELRWDRARIRSTAMGQLVRRRQDGEIPEGVGQRLRAVGMATDKSKVLLWRNETLPLPQAMLADAARLDRLQTGLGVAEHVWSRAVRRSLGNAAAAVLAPLSDHRGARVPRREDCDALVRTTSAEATYWSALGQGFPGWLLALERGAPDAQERWAVKVRSAARDAFARGCRGLGEGARVLKGEAIARGSLEAELAAATHPLEPKEIAP